MSSCTRTGYLGRDHVIIKKSRNKPCPEGADHEVADLGAVVDETLQEVVVAAVGAVAADSVGTLAGTLKRVERRNQWLEPQDAAEVVAVEEESSYCDTVVVAGKDIGTVGTVGDKVPARQGGGKIPAEDYNHRDEREVDFRVDEASVVVLVDVVSHPSLLTFDDARLLQGAPPRHRNNPAD